MEDVRNQLAEIYSLAANRKDYAAALSACDEIIQSHPELTEGLKTRAQIYAHKADFRLAIEDMTHAIQKGGAEPGDFFFRGWWNLEDDDISDAIEDFTEAINLGGQLGSDYFTESAHFLRAVAEIQQGRYDEALADCTHVRDDFLIYLRSGQVSKSQIIETAKSKSDT